MRSAVSLLGCESRQKGFSRAHKWSREFRVWRRAILWLRGKDAPAPHRSRTSCIINIAKRARRVRPYRVARAYRVFWGVAPEVVSESPRNREASAPRLRVEAALAALKIGIRAGESTIPRKWRCC